MWLVKERKGACVTPEKFVPPLSPKTDCNLILQHGPSIITHRDYRGARGEHRKESETEICVFLAMQFGVVGISSYVSELNLNIWSDRFGFIPNCLLTVNL